MAKPGRGRGRGGGRKAVSKPQNDAPGTPKAGTKSGTSSSTPRKTKNVTPVRVTPPRRAKEKTSGLTTSTPKETGASRKRTHLKVHQLATPTSDNDFEDGQLKTTPEVKADKGRKFLKKYLKETEKFEKRCLDKADRLEAERDAKRRKTTVGTAFIDKDDELSDDAEQDILNNSQVTMGGGKDYSQYPYPHPGENNGDNGEDEEGDEGGNQGFEGRETDELSYTSMIDDANLVDENGRSYSEWWLEDPTREEALCLLWQEETSLYVAAEDGHRNPSHRNTIIKKIAIKLRVPPKVVLARMGSLRNAYQKMCKDVRSGSAPIPKTKRQSEIARLVYFLRDHVNTRDTITSYKGVSPAAGKAKRALQFRTKSTPTRNIQVPLRYNPETYVLPQRSPVVKIRTEAQVHRSQEEEDEEQDEEADEEAPSPVFNLKHYSYNHRLKDAKIVKSLSKTSQSLKQVHSPVDEVIEIEDPEDAQETQVQRGAKGQGNIRLVQPTKAPLPRKSPIPKKHESLPPPPTSALERVKSNTLSKTVLEKKVTVRGLARNQPKVRNTQKPGSSFSVESDESGYDISLDRKWYEKQGPDYRKLKELANKEAKKNDPMVSVMEQKAAAIQDMTNKMASSMQRTETILLSGNQEGNKITSVENDDITFLESILPKMSRMTKKVKDKFEVKVFTLAVEAANGDWPTDQTSK